LLLPWPSPGLGFRPLPNNRPPKLSKSERSDEFIIERIRKGKTGAMPGFGEVFSDGQIIAILAYIRGLDD